MPCVPIGKNKTRDGRDVFVFTNKARGDYPVVGVIINNQCDDPASWTIDGIFNKEKEHSPCDLMILSDEPGGENCQ